MTIIESHAKISKNTYRTDRIMVRSIIGGIIGDVVGSSREGYGRNAESPKKLLVAKSHFTDDTTLMIAVADWLNHKEDTTLKDSLIKWYNRYPHSGFGGLFKVFAKTGVAQASNANGGAMRVAPCATVAETMDETLKLAEEQCRVSHTTDMAINGAKAIAAAIFIAKDGASQGKSDKKVKAEIKSYIEENFGYDLNKSLAEIQERSAELKRQRAEYRKTRIASPTYQNMSNASLSCPMAIKAFLLGNNFEETLRYSLAMGGDSDTIACMAGSISAQLYGIPEELVKETLAYLPVEMIDVLNEFEPENSFKA